MAQQPKTSSTSIVLANDHDALPGVSSLPATAAEAAQATMLASMFNQAQEAGAKWALWYRAYENGQGFGLVDGTRKKPAYFAFQGLANQ